MTCAIQGCGAVLRSSNRSGHCQEHRRYSEARAIQGAVYERTPARRAANRARYERKRRLRPCPSSGCHRLIGHESKMCAMHAALASWERKRAEGSAQ